MSESNGNDFRAMGKWMMILMWVIGIALMTQFFSKILDHKNNPNQNLTTLELEDGSKEVILRASRHGHFITRGAINNQRVLFLLDSGASFVAIPQNVAQRIGLEKGAPMTVTTANGRITIFDTRLDSISIGDITLYDVQAGINPYMQGEEILLGMSFLRELSITQENDTLTIRQ
jgi:aspartyl protease family protein